MERLLTHLEAAKDEYSVVRLTQDCSMVDPQASTMYENQYSQLSVPPTRFNTGWKKLDEYYQKTD
jgi:hypothetical protein